MKFVIILVILGAIGGGVYFGMKTMGIPPFKKAGKTASKTADAKSTPDPAVDAAKSTAPVRKNTINRFTRPTPTRLSDVEIAKQDAKIARLSSVYEQMPVEDAGKIMAKLPDPLVEKLLRKMDERQTGKLLLTFGPDRAAKLSIALSK